MGGGRGFCNFSGLVSGPRINNIGERAWSHLQNFPYVLSPTAFIWARQIIFTTTNFLSCGICFYTYTEQVTTYGENGLLFLVESDEFIEGQNVDQDSKGKW